MKKDANWWKPYKDSVYEVHRLGLVRNKHTKTILTEFIDKGYIKVQMWINGVKKNKRVHILVAELYVDKPELTDNIVNHLNSCKLDSYHRNLEWTTISGNTKYAVEQGQIDMNYVRSFKNKKYGESAKNITNS